MYSFWSESMWAANMSAVTSAISGTVFENSFVVFSLSLDVNNVKNCKIRPTRFDLLKL